MGSLSLREALAPQLSTHRSTVYLYLALQAFLYHEPEPTRKPFALLDRLMQSQIFTSYAPKPTLYLCPGTS